MADTLSGSAICRKLPLPVRMRLDSALLRRPAGLKTLEEIARRFDLAGHGISITTLRSYARRLEALARPAAAGQVLASILGCLPPGYERRIRMGTQVLLLSRVVQALAGGESALSVAELVRLGSLLAALARPAGASAAPPPKKSSCPQAHRRKADALPPERIRELIRDVYGLNLRVDPADARQA
ncbi:MAG: hypothetical protein HRF43_01530 [Phycisphaerae bacterium]